MSDVTQPAENAVESTTVSVEEKEKTNNSPVPPVEDAISPEVSLETEVASPSDISLSDDADVDLLEGEFTMDDEPKSKRTPLTVPKAVNIALIAVIVISFSVVLFFLPKLFS